MQHILFEYGAAGRADSPGSLTRRINCIRRDLRVRRIHSGTDDSGIARRQYATYTGFIDPNRGVIHFYVNKLGAGNMIKVTVLYPNEEDKKFEASYALSFASMVVERGCLE